MGRNAEISQDSVDTLPVTPVQYMVVYPPEVASDEGESVVVRSVGDCVAIPVEGYETAFRRQPSSNPAKSYKPKIPPLTLSGVNDFVI